MRPLQRLSIANFRTLLSVTVDLQPLNVLVGPNGAGKSNLIDAIRFLRDSVRMDLLPALDARGGMDRVYFRGDTKGPMVIGVEARVTANASARALDEYTLKVSRVRLLRRSDRSIRTALRREESFKFKRTQGAGRRITISGSKFSVIDTAKTNEKTEIQRSLQETSLGLAILPKLAADEGGREVGKLAELFGTFKVFDVDVAAARLPSLANYENESRESIAIDENGSNLAAALRSIAKDEFLWRRLQSDAQHFIPGLVAIHFRVIAGSTSAVVVELEETGLDSRTDLADASYGTIRALALLALLHDQSPPKLTCIEEIDHGLHPYVFDRLVELLRDASKRTQIVVATHSPALVNRLHPGELIVCERDPATGASAIPAIDPTAVALMADDLEGEYGLGELWFSGSLGGVLR